jgi:6,7-dimethyl-8-ribityllumazine synthase
MAGTLKSGKIKSTANLSKKKFAIVVAEWNEDITEALYEGAVASLLSHGVKNSTSFVKMYPAVLN